MPSMNTVSGSLQKVLITMVTALVFSCTNTALTWDSRLVTSLDIYQWSPLIGDQIDFLLPNICSILCCVDTLQHKGLEKLPFVKGLQAITSFSRTHVRQHS